MARREITVAEVVVGLRSLAHGAADGFANRHVLRQVTPGLAHHPDRRDGLASTGKDFKEGFDSRGLCQFEFPGLDDKCDCQS